MPLFRGRIGRNRPQSAFKAYETNDILKTSGRYAAVTTNPNPKL